MTEIAAHSAALGKQGGNSSQGFFSATGNDNSALDFRIVQRTADESGQGEMKEFCGLFEFQFFSFRHKVWGNFVIAPLCFAQQICMNADFIPCEFSDKNREFLSKLRRNLMMCVLLFVVSWRWVVLGLALTFVLVIVPPVVLLAPRWSYVSTTRRCCSHRQVRTISRVWGRHAPTRSLRKCRCIEEVKSRWSTTFSRIENLWPRDGSCPLPLRSKHVSDSCFRIVKTQK